MIANADLSASFKLAMRRLATTVSVITCRDEGTALGMTATAVSSLCAEPASVLVCVNRATGMHRALSIGTAVCLNLLAEHHGDVCYAFGGRVSSEEKFGVGEWSDAEEHDAPYLVDAQANLFSTVDAIFDYGTHSIVVCKVKSIRFYGEVRPLIFGDGDFLPLGARA